MDGASRAVTSSRIRSASASFGIGSNGVRANHHPFVKLEGVALHDFAVFEGARFGFVGIGNDVVGPFVFVNETPLQPGGEAGPPTPAQAGFEDFFNDFFGFHRGDDFLKCLKAAVFNVHVKLVNFWNISVTEKNVGHNYK